MKLAQFLLFAAPLWLPGAQPGGDRWLDALQPIITADEKQIYLTLDGESARENFQQAFWQARTIQPEEYYRRLSYVDQVYGSTKPLSGTRTDRGRVYFTLGAPHSITQIVSSRTFFPLEVWYYEGIQADGIPASLNLIFFRRNGTSDYSLYSPQLDTIRALLNPNTSNRGKYPKNDLIDPMELRQELQLSPAEAEIVEPALHVARGITGAGNDIILGRIGAPRSILNRSPHSSVTSRFYPSAGHATARMLQMAPDAGELEGAVMVDLALSTTAQDKISLVVKRGDLPVAETTAALGFDSRKKVEYRHRLYLLPGDYVLLFAIDGQAAVQELKVSGAESPGPLVVGRAGSGAKPAPFRFGTLLVSPSRRPDYALLRTASTVPLRWTLTRGSALVWTAMGGLDPSLPQGFAGQKLPADLPAGRYTLTARTQEWEQSSSFEIDSEEDLSVVSYNANLSLEEIWNGVGRQYLVRKALDVAARCFDRAMSSGGSDETVLNVARLKAMRGDLDGGRDLVTPILDRQPAQFEALAFMGYVEARLQDYRVAADYYRRALAVRRTPELANALATVERLGARLY